MSSSNILLYQSADGLTRLDVQLQHETVWLTQAQMAELFDTTKQNISLHTRNAFREGELEESSVVKDFLTTAVDGKNYQTKHYNLDVIISVGYRVKSRQGTQFRQWATRTLREFLVQGFALNEKRLRQDAQQLRELKRLLALQGEIVENQELTPDQTTALLRVLSDYARALDVLDQYDHQRLRVVATSPDTPFELTYEAAMRAVDGLRAQFGGSTLFGREKDQSFESSVRTIYQSFGGEELYPSVEEKAANLLYFVVKNHSFSDGNKRIAAFSFADLRFCSYGLWTKTAASTSPTVRAASPIMPW
ncbi:virulence protein RhuM/Fic/DOC family protein [Hymenobacter aerophilus]|uniref:virulence protein RhuM/Fic/DOC family protein n=1 Tax=Hymenobacter aerophilus TaxID=119644 RepID=UPI00039B07AD|nr:virulence protein RhuM/Fic/DOC family protein [Hymenobacter aerophilus]